MSYLSGCWIFKPFIPLLVGADERSKFSQTFFFFLKKSELTFSHIWIQNKKYIYRRQKSLENDQAVFKERSRSDAINLKPFLH